LGAVVEHTSYHMVYILYQNKVSPYINNHQHYATFQPSCFNLVDQCVSQKINCNSTFDGMFLQAFRVHYATKQMKVLMKVKSVL
jgi:hypothetical protein